MKSFTHFEIICDAQKTTNQRTFIVDQGFYNEGDIVAVQAIARRKKSRTVCDLEIQLLTDRLEEDTHPAVIEGAREACEEAQRDNNPSIQTAAQQALKSLDLPRLKPDDLEGIHFSLWAATQTPTMVGSGDTDKKGKMVFHQVLLGAEVFLLCSEGVETRIEKPHPVKGMHPQPVDDGSPVSDDPDDPVHSEGSDGVLERALQETTPYDEEDEKKEKQKAGRKKPRKRRQ